MSDKTYTVGGDGIVREVRSLVEEFVPAHVIEVADPVTGDKVPFVQSGRNIVPLPSGVFEQYRDRPIFRHGTATLLSLASLIDHVNRFKDSESVVFADDDRVRPSITAVLDYHPAGGAAMLGHDIEPRYGAHRSVFAFPLSDEWKAWMAHNGEDNAMGMADFAAFVEDRLPDVLFVEDDDGLPEDIARLIETLGGASTIATPNKLMELSRGLQVNEESTVAQAVNLQTGEGLVTFNATHTDASGAPLRVPAVFLIGIPVFRNGQFWRIAARLRCRKRGGGLIFWYELYRTDRTFDAAFQQSVEQVREETGLPVLIGRPESAAPPAAPLMGVDLARDVSADREAAFRNAKLAIAGQTLR